MSLIRGVLLAGKFRTQDELNGMSHDDQRNTLIVVLTGLSNQSNYQSFYDATLAGMGAVLVFLREAKIRNDRDLKTMSADDQRNVLIVELGAQTNLPGPVLQGLSNMDLVLLGLGKDGSFIRGVLLAGKFRTQHELNGMSNDDQRNTLIVELAGRTNQSVAHFQSLDDATLAGTGAVLVFLREAKIRDDKALKTMSDDDQRNTLIVEIDAQTHLGSRLQGLTNMDLVLMGFGSIIQHQKGVPPGPVDGPELGDKHGKGDDGPKEAPGDPPPEDGPSKNPDNQPPPPTGCFIGDTPVLMADGLTKTIDAIAIGDQVMARDEKTGITAVGAVARVFRHRVAETLLLQMEGGEVVETTAAHRFAAEERGFVSADQLRPGDRLSTHNDRGAEVVSTGTRSAEVTVYNLSVDRFHTFFICGAGLWVHNLKKGDPSDPPDQEP
jgi:hypothetical protein